jgi:DNA polymerase
MIADKFVSNVLSNMNGMARFVVVGQNPGRDEVERGEPFVGISGRFFDKAIGDVLHLNRTDFYITNTVKCFTPDNRKPYMDEEDNCRYFLDREIEILKPKLIVALGGSAFKRLTGMGGVLKHHGTAVLSLRYKLQVVPMLHPSPLNMNDPAKRDMFYADLAKLGGMMSAEEP